MTSKPQDVSSMLRRLAGRVRLHLRLWSEHALRRVSPPTKDVRAYADWYVQIYSKPRRKT